MRDSFKLAVAVIACEVAGVVGSAFTAPSVTTWYASLAKPALAPPNWLFAPVWTTLFAMMGVAAFLVWRRGLKNRGVKTALVIFGSQMILNILWSALFFGLRNPAAAFIEIILLWLAILGTIIVFNKVSRVAAGLLIPYILWVTLASYLNFMLWRLN